MESRWLVLLLSAALLQASVLSDRATQDDIDEEWSRFSAILRDPAYRLPTTTLPRHYEVSLTPYFNTTDSNVTPFTFDGEVTIYLSPTQADVAEIVMHCNDLVISSLNLSTIVNGVEEPVSIAEELPTCEMPYSFLRIVPTTALTFGQEYIARMTFTGNLQTNMRGFYRSWYYDSTGKKWMGTTQFQPGHARQAFPCYDEPGFKATFDITMNREADYSPTISNMPIRTNETLANGRISETFYTTPLTSTYLLAFIVSHYEVVAQNTDVNRPFEIYARDNANATGDWSLEIGELLLEAMEELTNISYYNMADNMNMKQAAIPDFSAGAMENWGLLTYREALILYDPLNSNHFYRHRVANIVAHEIAHMWFGNLVTCAWWDNLWLNEGFARFYQYYLTDLVAPDMGFPIRFIVEQLQVSMLSDSVDSAHALTNPDVNDPTTVSAHFSTITYAKGASILRMTQHLLGESTYLKALRSYLYTRQYNVAEPDHLFDALDAAAEEDNALALYPGVTIAEYFKTWSEKGGHPLLTVVVDHSTGLMTVTQARWERDTGVSSNPSLWQIPITWTMATSPEFDDLKPSQIISDQVSVIDRGTTGLEWVIFNKQQSGFYRVNYDDNTWALITNALRGSERTLIHEINRAQIVDDVFILARAVTMDYRKALNILSFLEFEDAYAPWYSAITGFSFLLNRLASDETNLIRLQNEIIRLSAAITTRLGYTELASDTFMDGLLRMYVMDFLCDAGHPECRAAGVTNFQNWMNNGQFIPANMRPWVYCAGLRNGTTAEYYTLWNHYENEDLSNEMIVILQKLGCSPHEETLSHFLEQIVTENEQIRSQDYTTALSSTTTRNPGNAMIVFEWLKNNIDTTSEAFGGLSTPLNYIAARLTSEEQITEFENWLTVNQAMLGTDYINGMSYATSARNNIAWTAARVSEMIQYFDEGYVNMVEELSTEAPSEVTVQPDTETPDEPDSANVAALSIITLLAMLGFNMF